MWHSQPHSQPEVCNGEHTRGQMQHERCNLAVAGRGVVDILMGRVQRGPVLGMHANHLHMRLQ